MTYYNNISSRKFLIMTVLCYIIFFAITYFVLSSDFATNDFIRAKVVKLYDGSEYIVDTGNKPVKDASMIIVADGKIQVCSHDETRISRTSNGLYQVSFQGIKNIKPSHHDLIYIFPHDN